MKGFCPSCDKESELTRVQRVENITVKGEIIPVDVDYFICAECGEEFDNPEPAYDPLAVAFQEYRRRKGMVQPQDIRSFREKYGLTQHELSGLLGFGGATLSRYENGALQDDTHNKILRLVMEPQNLLEILQQSPTEFNSGKREKLTHRLQDEVIRSELHFFLKKSRDHYRAPNLFNGFREFDLDRVLNGIKILCYQTNTYKTKLNKLLFYADFKHFKQYGLSITSLCYAHLPLGPVPDQYQSILQRLIEIDPTLINEEDTSMDCVGEFFRCDFNVNTTIFNHNEISTLIYVREHFRSLSASEIVDLSHEEEAYKQTRHAELIPYTFACKLQL